MLQRLRNGDGDGESEEQVSCPGSPRCPLIDDEAKCGDGSPDEELNEHEYNTPDDKRFIVDHNEDQQHDTDAHHRQCDNQRVRDHCRDDDSYSAFLEYLDDFDMALVQDESEKIDHEVPELEARLGGGLDD